MPQAIALSTELVGLTEEMIDGWDRACADGHLCPLEIARISAVIGEVNALAGLVDLAQAAGLAVIRRGAINRRPSDLLGQLTDRQTA